MFSLKNIPTFAKVEFQKLEERLKPSSRKATKYGIFALPLVFISLVNLLILTFSSTNFEWEIGFIYALIGAVGMALLKESRYQQKKVQEEGSDYILQRIGSSEFVSNPVKRRYKKLIIEEPLRAIPLFIEFLEKEEELIRRERVAQKHIF